MPNPHRVPVLTSLRLDEDTIGRADKLARVLNREAVKLARSPIRRSDVLRTAILRGLRVMEREERKRRAGS